VDPKATCGREKSKVRGRQEITTEYSKVQRFPRRGKLPEPNCKRKRTDQKNGRVVSQKNIAGEGSYHQRVKMGGKNWGNTRDRKDAQKRGEVEKRTGCNGREKNSLEHTLN